VTGRSPWLSTEQASVALGIKPRELYRLIDHGEVPGYRIGWTIKVKRADVEAYANANGTVLRPIADPPPFRRNAPRPAPGVPEEWADSNEVAISLGLSHRDSVTTYMRQYPDMPI
jgi:excisionase family DNA binding protein